MNINQLEKPNQMYLENLINSLNKISSISFKLEMPRSESFDMLLQELDQIPEAEENMPNTAQLKNAKAAVLNKVRELAKKERIILDMKDIKEVRLHVRSHDLFNREEYSLNVDSLKDSDIKFLKECVNNPNIVIDPSRIQDLQQNIPVQNQSGQSSFKSVDFSKGLANLIEYAYKTQRPIRLDFEGNSSVILKIDNNGKLTAEFISSNKAMEQIIKSSLPDLRNRLNSEGIEYKEITYKDEPNDKKKQEHGG